MSKDIISNDVPWLKDHTILLTITGSHAYGTNTETSDMDYKGVCIPPKEYYLGLDSFNEYNTTGGKTWKNTKDDVDIAISHINKFVMDAMKGVPNNIEMLFTNPEHVIYKNEFGEELISHRYDFLTKALKHKFGGYAHAQKKKILIKNSNGTGRKDLIERFGYDTKFAMHSVRLLTSGIEILETGEFCTYSKHREHLLDIRNGNFGLDEILGVIDALDNKLERLYEVSDIPHKPDYDKINKWLIELNEKALNTKF